MTTFPNPQSSEEMHLPQGSKVTPPPHRCPIRGQRGDAIMMSVKQRYHDISPVTLQVVEGAVSSSLYCGEVEGLSGGLVEAFLVEFYRCKLCQYTCTLKASISSHLLVRHRSPVLAYLGEADRGDRTEGREEAELDQLDLNAESKQSDEDEEFLLYNMLDNMSPPTCDLNTEEGLQVAHTCEVSTLFEEEDSSIFRLKGGSVDLSCPIDPPATQEEMAQSAHLMSLGLCRISATKPPLPPPATLSHSVQHPPPPAPPTHSLKQNRKGNRKPPSTRRKLPCLLCPLTLTPRRLLNVHIRSHHVAGGFSCVCCSWKADSWEELEPHWRSHCKRRKRRVEQKPEEQQQKKKKKKKGVEAVLSPFSCPVCRKIFRNAASQKAHQQTHRHTEYSGKLRGRLTGQAGGRKTEHSKSRTSHSQSGSLQSIRDNKSRRQNEEELEEKGFCCSLCHRKFSSKLTLRRHLGVHGGEKPFTCPHCAYSSRLKASLLQHLRTHTGEKPYRCADCSYASIDRSSLLRHSRTHSQEKPYRCQHCDYRCIQKKSLDLHARRHHTGEAFLCQECQYSSPDRQLLLRHTRRHHGHCNIPTHQNL
ncbi:hypothetical protein Q5P01_023014 [Channa striata]|uniref:C2H2-type domain-containing protein n=1 Tax=Channa striata TaxID=64152 RepID=A0AA88LS51_CHASR|nr:hypothetical protein Q5P01_023014 [Channa striata]